MLYDGFFGLFSDFFPSPYRQGLLLGSIVLQSLPHPCVLLQGISCPWVSPCPPGNSPPNVRLVPPPVEGGGLHHTVLALTLQQFQCYLKKTFLQRLVFPMLFCQRDGPPWGGLQGWGGGGGAYKWAGGTVSPTTRRNSHHLTVYDPPPLRGAG